MKKMLWKTPAVIEEGYLLSLHTIWRTLFAFSEFMTQYVRNFSGK